LSNVEMRMGRLRPIVRRVMLPPSSRVPLDEPTRVPFWLRPAWPGLRSVLAVESIRSVDSAPTKVESEIRYFLSSCPDGPATLGKAIRSHWAVENALHCVLDVTFREDDSRVRDRTAVRNLALLRKIALNIVGRDRTTKASVRARRKKAAWNDAYMLKLMAG